MFAYVLWSQMSGTVGSVLSKRESLYLLDTLPPQVGISNLVGLCLLRMDWISFYCFAKCGCGMSTEFILRLFG